MHSADNLLASLYDILHERTFGEVKQEVSGCIGIVGVVMGAEAQR